MPNAAKIPPVIRQFLHDPGDLLPQPLRRWYQPQHDLANEFHLARFLILRFLGLCYAMAFLVAINQGPGLIGENGILPMSRFLNLVSENYGGPWNGFLQLPSIFWIDHSNAMFLAVAWIGLALSIAVLCGYCNSLILIALWAMQMSLVHVGQLFWGYGWETQLLETGFLAIFLVPLLDGRPFSNTRPSRIILWLYRWLIIRIMIGAGLIKLRGDAVWDWAELSALFYHFETQPIPNGFSWFFHHLPKPALQAGVAVNHIVELIIPFFLLLPRHFRNWAGVIMILFQVNLIVSGNLSFLNYLTIIPCLACIDDRFYRKLMPRSRWAKLGSLGERGRSNPIERRIFLLRRGILILVCILSINPVLNLMSSKQAMNTSFDRLHLVNTYGAFGSIGKVRREITIEGTDHPNPLGGWAKWTEYKFHGKPGDPARRPPNFAPYQHRLDWDIWFAAGGSLKGEPWLHFLAIRLMQGHPETVRLFRENPFPNAPPTAIRMNVYKYRFSTPEERRQTGRWWIRELEGVFISPLNLDNPQLQAELERFRWQ